MTGVITSFHGGNMHDDDEDFFKAVALAVGAMSLCLIFGAVLAVLALRFLPALWQFLFL